MLHMIRTGIEEWWNVENGRVEKLRGNDKTNAPIKYRVD